MNQILASVAGYMCVIFTAMIAGDTIMAHVIFLLFTFPFFVYIEYRAAFKYGFHDPDRRNNPKSKKYIFKGALAGLISAIPLYALIITFLVSYVNNVKGVSMFSLLYTRMFSMYYNWPMCNIFPNHVVEVLLTSMVPVIILPMLGYIAGYKNILLTDPIYKLFKITPKRNNY